MQILKDRPIVKMSAQTMHIGFRHPVRVAFGTLAGLDAVEVRIERDGIVGRGECCPMLIYDQTTETTLAEIDAVIPAIVSGAMDRQSLQQAMPRGSARNAVDCALWDLEAKTAGCPVWEIAGLPAPETIASDVTIGILSPAETVRAATAHRDASMIKLKLGGERDLDCVRAVRSVLPETPLFVDVNAGWTLDRLNLMAPHLAEAGIFMIEQPLPPRDDHLLDLYTGTIALCADESCHDRSDLDRLAGRFAYINIKLDKTGGLTEALALAATARERGFRLMTGGMVGTGLAVATAYLVASLSEVVDLDMPLLVADPGHAGVRHDGRLLHRFGQEVWG